MDVKVTLKIEGLEPLASAINNLATAYSNSGAAAAAVIDKAKGSKTKPAAEVKAEDPKPADTQPASTATTTESQAPVSNETATESPSEGKTEGQTTAETPSATTTKDTATASISDEDLRAAAGEAAKRDKQKVRDLVAKYAPNVSAIPAEVRADFLKELAAV